MANEVVSVPHERELYVSLNKVGNQIKSVMPKSWDDEDFKRLLSMQQKIYLILVNIRTFLSKFTARPSRKCCICIKKYKF